MPILSLWEFRAAEQTKLFRVVLATLCCVALRGLDAGSAQTTWGRRGAVNIMKGKMIVRSGYTYTQVACHCLLQSVLSKEYKIDRCCTLCVCFNYFWDELESRLVGASTQC